MISSFFFFLLINLFPISSPIEILQIRENTNVTINCYFNFLQFSPRENIILWYKDRTHVIGVNSISNNPKKYFLNQLLNSTYQLIIYNVQLESSGLYRCQSFQEKQEKHFQLNVLVPPSNLSLQSSHRFPVPDGSLITFNCTTQRVYPNPIFKWYKNDQLIQRSIGNQTFFSSSAILTLFLTPADHNHILRCQVSNEASAKEISIENKLEVLFKPMIKFSLNRKELQNKTISVIEQTSAIIRCQILSNPSITSKIEWLKDDQLIDGEDQEEIHMNFTEIRKLSCRAQNDVGESEESLDINLLYFINELDKPKLSLNKNVTIHQNERVILKCSIDANPKCFQIRWLFNGKELSNQFCSNEKSEMYVIDDITREQAGIYTCEVKNQLNEQIEGISSISTDIRVRYPPVILNKQTKLAVRENFEIRTQCLVNADPRAEIIWFGPTGQRLSTFTREEFLNETIVSSRLNLPATYSSILGSYRCIAKNLLGQNEISIEFQRPGLPDPPIDLKAINITHSSFILTWQSGYNGGSEEIFHLILSEHSIDQEKSTHLNYIRFDDLNENTFYTIRIRSKNQIGFSSYTKVFRIRTKEFPWKSDDFPMIQRAYFIPHTQRIRFQLGTIGSFSLDELCVQAYNSEEISTCIPLKSLELLNKGLDLKINEKNLRLRLCLINQTENCSKSISIPSKKQLENYLSDWILIFLGGLLGLIIVFILIILFICIRQQKEKHRSKNGSTDTLKTNQSIPTVRVSDNQTRTLYYNDETIGVYSIQDRKNSVCLDSGMPSTISTNSDSIASQALTSSDFYERSDGDELVHGRLSTSPKFCQQGKKLVYEVIV